MDRIAFADIQGVILRGYKELGFARFVLLRFGEGAGARAWLAALPITSAAERSRDVAAHVAFTWEGLTAVAASPLEPGAFAPEFREGMSSDEHRSRVLGDVGVHGPANWLWGGPADSIHAVLLLYAETEAKLDELEARVCKATAVNVVHRLETHTLRDGDGVGKYWFREHFGFRDGVAQPRLALHASTPDEMRRGIAKYTNEDNAVRAGEFLFGYENEYGKKPDGAGPPELAQHGSFLVFRQLEQDVCGFWQFVRKQANELGMSPVLLASKMVGRWPNGAPLVRAPTAETAGLEQFDEFGYAESDMNGHKCPFGSHIRRTNPRDGLFDDKAESVRIANRHRLVRRGRPYGAPVSTPLDPSVFLPKLDAISSASGVPRGLHFLCFNANIRRQFEFVQQTWVNNPKFPHQYDGPDPIVAQPGGGEFELPGEPARRRVAALESFVTMRGGAYFFMPGLRGLAWLARGSSGRERV
jgi:Dyp-type peroxidase family